MFGSNGVKSLLGEFAEPDEPHQIHHGLSRLDAFRKRFFLWAASAVL